MTIVVIGGNYYIPVTNGFKQISKAEALDLYETGAITTEEVINYENE
jgi:hypothetical protein